MTRFALRALALTVASIWWCAWEPVASADDSVHSSGPKVQRVVSSVATTDRELLPGGLLVGRVLDEQGSPVSHQEVFVTAAGHKVATTRTDEHGVFAVSGLRGGVHMVVCGEAGRLTRFWTAGTAPPGAQKGMFVVSNDAIVRGQWGPPPAANGWIQHTKRWGSNPFVVAGVITAAVAIPVALLEDDDPSS